MVLPQGQKQAPSAQCRFNRGLQPDGKIYLNQKTNNIPTINGKTIKTAEEENS